MFEYEKYLLKENPFPVNAAIDPTDPDPRMNGTIFLKDIFEREIQDLYERTERGINLIYISGIEHDKGVGKSALMIHHWRECLQKPNSTSLYIRLDETDKPKDICRKIITQWHNDETLWKAFQTLFLDYCREQSNPMLQTDAVEYLFEKHPNLCPDLQLTLYTQIRNSDSIGKQFTSYLQSKTRIDPKNIEPLIQKYLTEPTTYLDVLNASKTNTSGVFRDLVKILDLQNYKRHYIFLDQFEDMITGSTRPGIAKLSLELKNILLASSRKVSFFMTLHPHSEMLLQGMEAKDLTGIAPLDTIHRVNVMVLDRKGDQAAILAQAYMEYYRTQEPPYPTYPLEEDLVHFLCYLEVGNIRALLQHLYNCIEYGSMKELEEITLKYALENPQEILGREVNQKQIDRFQTIQNRS
jgi:hypothetical protein